MREIPETGEPGLYIAASFSGSPFVELKTDAFFDIKMMYPLLNMKQAESRCFVRKEVKGMLKDAAKALPKGWKLRILDAWRPVALQKELYTEYSGGIIKEFGLETVSKEEREAVIRKYVSDPVADPLLPPVHTTGGAVDVTVIDDSGRELEMGTEFDAFSEKTNTAYFEKTDLETIKNNRRLLYRVMTGAGFTNLPSEWWHYDYGDRFWAYYNDRPAIYEGVFTAEELLSGKRKKQ